MFTSKGLSGIVLFLSWVACESFVAPGARSSSMPNMVEARQKSTALQMGLDMVTYLRVEWISAAICTNQTPRDADVCLQLGCEDGRAVTFIPKTVEELITSTVEPDGIMPVNVNRQLTQQQQSRNAARVVFANQRADDLKETEDESVDVVLSLQACARMIETGLDWKKSVQEAARVLKPGGRLIFVEQPELDGDSYLDYLANLCTPGGEEEEEQELYPVFEPIGYDDVDLVLVPHVAGVVVKKEDAGLTAAEREQKLKDEEADRLADISLSAFERGIKKRKRKKKKKAASEEA